MAKPRILFMGTPEFAVPSLAALVERDYPIMGVVTQPDRPKGRGRETIPSPVKAFAEEHRLHVIQPERLAADSFLKQFESLSPDMVVLAAFGQILPAMIITAPGMGCINVHPSLLPKYRGAAPINWAIIRGEQRTGVTIMYMSEGVDRGDIVLQREVPIGAAETYGKLHDRLAALGAELLLVAIEKITDGTATRTKQDDTAATYTTRLKKEDGLIRWNTDAADIVNLVRGLSPSPGAYTFLDGKVLKVLDAVGEEAATGDAAGRVGRETEKGLPVAARNGCVYLREIQMESRKKMSIREFLRGYPIEPGHVLGNTV
jgi:methionyl-tRNA formyltransferase